MSGVSNSPAFQTLTPSSSLCSWYKYQHGDRVSL